MPSSCCFCALRKVLGSPMGPALLPWAAGGWCDPCVRMEGALASRPRHLLPALPQLWGPHFSARPHSLARTWAPTCSHREHRHHAHPPVCPVPRAGPSEGGPTPRQRPCVRGCPGVGRSCPGLEGCWEAGRDPALNPGAGCRATFGSIHPVCLLLVLSGKRWGTTSQQTASQVPVLLRASRSSPERRT